MEKLIRFAQAKDIKQIANIYTYFIENTAITFETVSPTLKEMENRLQETRKFYPWLVCEDSSGITGYAYASKHRQREAYQWSVDVTVYLKQGCGGQGLGTKLYSELIKLLKQQGFYNAYAGIALPNDASVALHEKLGFKKVAEYNNVGFKHGKWWNVGWWELFLQSSYEKPIAPISIQKLPDVE